MISSVLVVGPCHRSRENLCRYPNKISLLICRFASHENLPLPVDADTKWLINLAIGIY